MPAAPSPGALMAREAAEAPAAFARASCQTVPPPEGAFRALHTLARGSSDAAATVLAYEAMRETGLPCTSLPPSVFSLGRGLRLADTLVLALSQSGASEDLVLSARGARAGGARVVALTNVDGSPLEREADLRLPLLAGEEHAIPATKSVVAAIGAGTALIGALAPAYAPRARAAAEAVRRAEGRVLPGAARLVDALAGARSVYVLGRDTGYGAAQETALKIKECCALHAEAHSAAEVLHGPLQLAAGGLTALLLETGAPGTAGSLRIAAERLTQEGAAVHRLSPDAIGAGGLTPAAAAALLLCLLYPVIREAALARGQDPDAPRALSKVTRTV
ncbi:glutamine--fructose-6-phosphate transaminase [Rubellimicrobium thermophilum DSM 16684]|uniref:Glutamine--fructose-6-phosphate transaminase n=1 Tax=Rubellimicrobium thermophilum DSM 16684 TaxID=1123069 RepID=S9QZ72_9RHOB|nr:SIS domain-containing protein [Rubellimicrobium thermophilum]EPX84912.1 glutamine--fructose-6-phosphate transaminase [Rubellimicrobium thermophilum DSM 16684]